MNVCLVKINGWPDTFYERIEILASNVDQVFLVRPAPAKQNQSLEAENVTVYDLYPCRGESIDELRLHLLIFPLYLLQAVLVCGFLVLRPTDRPDVLHAFDYVLGGLAITTVARVVNVPCVVSVRGITEPRYKNFAEETGGIVAKLNYRIVSLIPRFVLPHVDAVITKAGYQREYIQTEYGLKIPIKTLPTGVDFQRFDPDTTDCGPILDEVLDGRDRPEHIILHIGHLTPDKGLDQLVSLVDATNEDLPNDLVVLCVGRFRAPAFENQIRNRCDDLGGRIHVHPSPIPYDHVPELLACVNGVILLSEPAHEGTPRVLQEACTMERPIIASDVPGIQEAFSELTGCYLINRADEQAFLGAVEDIVAGVPSMNRDEFRSRFDIHHNYSQYVGVYETAINDR